MTTVSTLKEDNTDPGVSVELLRFVMYYGTGLLNNVSQLRDPKVNYFYQLDSLYIHMYIYEYVKIA